MKSIMIRTVLLNCTLFFAGTVIAQNSSERQATPIPALQTNYPRPETPEIKPQEITNVKVQAAKADTPPADDKTSATPSMEAKSEDPKTVKPNAETTAPSKY